MVLLTPLVHIKQEPNIGLKEILSKNPPYLATYRIMLNGRNTPLILDSAEMNPRAWVKKTQTGLIYGEALADFSGAFSGTHTHCFAKFRGKFFPKKEYETKLGRGNSVLFVPFLQPVFKETNEAFLFSSGKFYSLGQVFEITDWTSKGISGYIYMQDDGKPYNGPFNFDVPNAVYKQEFIIRGGKRTLLGKTLVKARS